MDDPTQLGEVGRLTAKEFHYTFANFHRDPPTKVDFHRKRAPLLFIAFAEDHIVPPKASRHNEEKYDDSVSITEFTPFAGAPGWEEEEVADYALRETHAAQAAIDQTMWCGVLRRAIGTSS